MKNSLIVGHRYLIKKPYSFSPISEITILEKATSYVKVKYMLSNEVEWISYDIFSVVEDLGENKEG